MSLPVLVAEVVEFPPENKLKGVVFDPFCFIFAQIFAYLIYFSYLCSRIGYKKIMMKRLLILWSLLMPVVMAAQMVQPVTWTGEEIGDSVRLKASIEEGWHMTIIEFGDREYDEEFVDSFVVTLAKS